MTRIGEYLSTRCSCQFYFRTYEFTCDTCEHRDPARAHTRIGQHAQGGVELIGTDELW